MKSHILHAIAAIAAASALSLATAATGPAVTFTPGPISSLAKADGANADQLNAIVQALNADTSLQRSKITVQSDESGNVILTGATDSQEQAERASQVAASVIGDGKVVNAIQPGRVKYRTWEVVG